MMVIDHWDCACCNNTFEETPPRNLDEMVRVPACPSCGSARVRIELASVPDPNGRKPGGRIREKPQARSHALYAARETNRSWKVIIGR